MQITMDLLIKGICGVHGYTRKHDDSRNKEKTHQIGELKEKLVKCDERINELTTAAAESMVHTGDKEALLNEMEEKYNLLKKKHEDYKKDIEKANMDSVSEEAVKV